MAAVSYALLERRTQAFTQTLRQFRSDHLVMALCFNGQFESRIGVVQPGMFWKHRRREAIKMYLFLAGIPQTSGQINAALKKGKLPSKAQDDDKATYASLYGGLDVGCFRRFGVKGYWTIARYEAKS